MTMDVDGRLTDEVSEIADRLTVAARSWARDDAMQARDPEQELNILLDAMNELNARRLRIAELESLLHDIDACLEWVWPHFGGDQADKIAALQKRVIDASDIV